MSRRSASFSHVIGFDDAPFAAAHRGDVPIVGAVFAGTRLEGVLVGRARRDGSNATTAIAGLIQSSRFRRQLQLVLLQGIALAGFNVVDLNRLHRLLKVPVMAIVRKRPRLERVRAALVSRVPAGERKWNMIARLGPVEPLAGVYVQRVGIGAEDAERVLKRLALHSTVPEPLRTAHLIAGAIGTGHSRGRV